MHRKLKPGLRARALRLLARRDYTRIELERKLAPHADNDLELQTLLEDFAAQGWISEARVVEQVVHAKRSRFGIARIRQALIEKGVSGEAVGAAVTALKDTELDAARAACERKFKASPVTTAEKARQVRFLQARGFSIEIAMRAVRSRES